jgi:hypothetical protein
MGLRGVCNPVVLGPGEYISGGYNTSANNTCCPLISLPAALKMAFTTRKALISHDEGGGIMPERGKDRTEGC